MAVLPAGDAVYNLPVYEPALPSAFGSGRPDPDELAFSVADPGFRTEILQGLQERLARLAGAVQRHGALAIGQIYHPGAEQSWDNFQPAVAPSAVRADASARVPHAMSQREIDRMVTAYVESASHIAGAGLDGVELHAGHGYLLNRFLSPYYNQRTDSYGGSAQGRLRLVRQILREVRQRMGPQPLLGIRLPTAEEVPGGLTAADVADIAEALSEDVSYFSLSLGNHDGIRDGRPTTAYTGPWLVGDVPAADDARSIRQRAGRPVIVTGRVTTPHMAEHLIESGAADLVGLARALVADGRFAERAIRGEDQEIVRCIGCNECTLVPFSCPVNPRAGREAELVLRPASKRHRVIVVGAGPAGVGAAATAAARGHDTVLLDAAPEAGGMATVLGASGVLDAWASFGARLQRTVRDSPVDFRPGSRAAVQDIAALSPDVVVLATGAHVVVPALPSDAAVRTGLDVLLHGAPATDGPVVVVGGPEAHLEPLIVAEAMLAAGQRVTILTEHLTLGPAVEPRTLNYYVGRLMQAGASLVPMTRALSWFNGVLRVENLYGRRESRIEAATVVVVSERRASDGLAGELERALPSIPVHVIGDALAPRRMTHAALEGARIGRVV
jgi:2,4-dienoyl-CoA reductase (NADPH2)